MQHISGMYNTLMQPEPNPDEFKQCHANQRVIRERGGEGGGGGRTRERKENTERDKGGNTEQGGRESLWDCGRVVIMHPGSQ